MFTTEELREVKSIYTALRLDDTAGLNDILQVAAIVNYVQANQLVPQLRTS